MSLFSCTYVAYDGTETLGIFGEGVFRKAAELGPGVIYSPQQSGLDKIKSWLYISAINFPYGLTETCADFYTRTGLPQNTYVDFKYVVGQQILPGQVKRSDITRVVRPTADEITRIMAKPDGHAISSKVKAYLFTGNELYPITETVRNFCKRANIPAPPI